MKKDGFLAKKKCAGCRRDIIIEVEWNPHMEEYKAPAYCNRCIEEDAYKKLVVEHGDTLHSKLVKG